MINKNICETDCKCQTCKNKTTCLHCDCDICEKNDCLTLWCNQYDKERK